MSRWPGLHAVRLKCALKMIKWSKKRTDVGPSFAPQSMRLTMQAWYEASLRPRSKCFLYAALICWVVHFVLWFLPLVETSWLLVLVAVVLTVFGVYLRVLVVGRDSGLALLLGAIDHERDFQNKVKDAYNARWNLEKDLEMLGGPAKATILRMMMDENEVRLQCLLHGMAHSPVLLVAVVLASSEAQKRELVTKFADANSGENLAEALSSRGGYKEANE